MIVNTSHAQFKNSNNCSTVCLMSDLCSCFVFQIKSKLRKLFILRPLGSTSSFICCHILHVKSVNETLCKCLKCRLMLLKSLNFLFLLFVYSG